MTLKIEIIAGPEDSNIIKVSGDVDMDSSPSLRSEITRLLKTKQGLKVDLSDVGYLDSSGIAVLIQGYKAAQKPAVAYALLNPSPQVKAVIDLAQLNRLFTIEELEG